MILPQATKVKILHGHINVIQLLGRFSEIKLALHVNYISEKKREGKYIYIYII